MNPVRFYWGLRHGFEPMPVQVREKAESADRYFYFVMYALTSGFVAVLMLHSGVHGARVGLQPHHAGSNVAIGIAAGAMLIVIQIILIKLFSKAAQPRTTDRFQRRSAGLWVSVFLAAAFAEEFWLAFCLASMRATGHSGTASIVVTTVVFGAVHLGYRIPGALSVVVRGVVSALLFFWLRSLIPMVLFHFIGDLGNLYWLRRSGQVAAP